MQTNPLFRLLLLINLCLTKFYEQWYPHDAHWQAAMVTPLLLLCNVLEIQLLAEAFSDEPAGGGLLLGDVLLTSHQQAYAVALPSLLLVGAVNYVLVYRRGKYEDYFFRLSHERTDILHRDFFVLVGYFVLTVVPVGYWLVQKIANMPS
ncbi:hypothetical protein I2I05_00990 [Hymenobacter sp. BT683]|uniref:Uncharacterized protein n=1 Tax=Hymenobacter jeongseonensis TaxID=2791027 RepID=A0ABS0ICB8_9BACT|nr:hypothetical protein [Hymenobacter jeongseonensis]MBF9235960.1 hypothetical protein [Hymenobacter jeongseonensis]